MFLFFCYFSPYFEFVTGSGSLRRDPAPARDPRQGPARISDPVHPALSGPLTEPVLERGAHAGGLRTIRRAGHNHGRRPARSRQGRPTRPARPQQTQNPYSGNVAITIPTN